jgi:hypothetical protein
VQLLREVAQLDWQAKGAHALIGGFEDADEDADVAVMEVDESDMGVMAATARLSGSTLRQLARTSPAAVPVGPAGMAAARAALARQQEAAAAAVAAAGGTGTAGSIGAGAAAGGQVSSDGDDMVTDDSGSDAAPLSAAEEAMRRLGTFDGALPQELEGLEQQEALEGQQQQQQEQEQVQQAVECQQAGVQHNDVHVADPMQQDEPAGITPESAPFTEPAAASNGNTSNPGSDHQASPALVHMSAVQPSAAHSPAGHTQAPSALAPGAPAPAPVPVAPQLTTAHLTALLQDLPADDPAAQKLARLQQHLQELNQQAGSEPGAAVAAVQTLCTLLQNLMNHPSEQKYRRLRLSNAAFMRKAGRFAAAVGMLQLVGFSEQQVDGDAVVVLRLDDPGLLWLVLSALRDAVAT